MTRARTVAWWTVPSLVCLLIHWQGFTAWFRADDFAWLSNFNRIHSFHDLLVILFLPQAQGTIRPFSERAFFVIGYGLWSEERPGRTGSATWLTVLDRATLTAIMDMELGPYGNICGLLILSEQDLSDSVA